MIAAAHYRQVRGHRSGWRRRRIELKLAFELEGLELAAADGRNDLGYRSRAEHDIHAQPLAHAPAFRELGETAHQSDGQATPAPLLFSKLAQQSLSFLNRLAAHRAGVDQNQVGFSKVVDKGVTLTSQLRLDRVSVVLVHLTPEGDDVRSHTVPESPGRNVAINGSPNLIIALARRAS